jgi:hypothetical protein
MRFLRMVCPEHLLEGIEGDLVQRFDREVKALGAGKARRRFVWNVIRFFTVSFQAIRAAVASPVESLKAE